MGKVPPQLAPYIKKKKAQAKVAATKGGNKKVSQTNIRKTKSK